MRMQDDESISKLAKKFALLNAIEHSGKADIGSVISRILSENADLRKRDSTRAEFST